MSEGLLSGYKYGYAIPYQQRTVYRPSVAVEPNIRWPLSHIQQSGGVKCLKSGTTSLQYRSNLPVSHFGSERYLTSIQSNEAHR